MQVAASKINSIIFGASRLAKQAVRLPPTRQAQTTPSQIKIRYPLFLLTKDAQKKKLSKRKRWYMGLCPKPRSLLKKRGQNFPSKASANKAINQNLEKADQSPNKTASGFAERIASNPLTPSPTRLVRRRDVGVRITGASPHRVILSFSTKKTEGSPKRQQSRLGGVYTPNPSQANVTFVS